MSSENRCTLQFPATEEFELSFYISERPEENPPRIFPRHMHDAIEILILLRGECSFSVESELYSLRPGNAVIIRPNEAHNCIISSKTLFHHLCFHLTPTKDGAFDEFLSFRAGGAHCVLLSEEDLARTMEIARLLHGSQDRIQQRFLTLEFLWIMQNSRPAENAGVEEVPEVLHRILSDIHENFTKIDRLEYLTETYFISQSTLGRLFRTYLHTTPKQYLETKRLACSRILLKQGYSVYDACTASGFSDYSNYIRLFRRRFGMTPKQYQSSLPFEIALQPYEDKPRSKDRSQDQ
ncbi:MAG: AraC family transcriptional regulator [Clostridia bacterium]|nr:AraC family transcriptional regulator [Clostridia bacterium]